MYSVAVELTARCNQRCTYCYNAWRDDGGAAMGELPPPLLRQLVERLLADAPELDHVTLTGGEPFLRADIHDLIALINAHDKGVCIISNGGAIGRETPARLAGQRVHYVQLTLAGGDAITHDAVCGARSFARVVDAIERLAAAGVTVAGSYLCTRRNYAQAGAVLQRFADLGVTMIAFNRFNPSGYSASAAQALLPTRSQVLRALGQVDAIAADRGLEITCTMPIPPCVVDPSEFPHIAFGSCSVGTSHQEWAVGPDGRLRLCTLQDGAVGSLFDSSLGELLARREEAEYRRKIPTFCQGCPHADTCLGGCGASAEWVLGDAAELDPFVAQHVYPDFLARAQATQTAPAPRADAGGPR